MLDRSSFPRWSRVLCTALLILCPLITVGWMLVPQEKLWKIRYWDDAYWKCQNEVWAWVKAHPTENLPAYFEAKRKALEGNFWVRVSNWAWSYTLGKGSENLYAFLLLLFTLAFLAYRLYRKPALAESPGDIWYTLFDFAVIAYIVLIAGLLALLAFGEWALKDWHWN